MSSIHEQLPNVIFAEDHPDTLNMYRLYGESLGWQIETATSAGELLDKVNAKYDEGGAGFDAIVTDINFMDAAANPQPRMTGFNVAAEIHRVYPDVPVIVVTAYSSFIIDDELKKISADIIKKPIEIDYVFNKIQTQIDFHRQSKSNFQGLERRCSIVNLSGHERRKTDRRLTISRPLQSVMANMRARASFQE